LEYATRTLSAAAIKSLKATPVLLIPSPGPKRTILVMASGLYLKFNTTPYTAPVTNNNTWIYRGPTNTNTILATIQSVIIPQSFMTSTNDAALEGPNNYSFDQIPQFEDQPLFISLPTDASGEFTLGDSTIKIWLIWTPLPTS
jgi:hypothetical protein